MNRKALGMRTRSSRPPQTLSSISAFAPLIEAAAKELRRPVSTKPKPVPVKMVSSHPKPVTKPKKAITEIPLRK